MASTTSIPERKYSVSWLASPEGARRNRVTRAHVGAAPASAKARAVEERVAQHLPGTGLLLVGRGGENGQPVGGAEIE